MLNSSGTIIVSRVFSSIKYCLTHAPILALPDDSGNFEIYSDASLNGLGYVLMQHGMGDYLCFTTIVAS